MIDAAVNLVVALPAEAKALNQLLGLRRLQPDAQFPLYTATAIALTLCGPGVEAAREAVAFLKQLSGNQTAVWLNIGIAGHPELPVGEALLASRVSSQSTGSQWRLSPPSGADCITGEVISFAQPCHDYIRNAACDMEAAGFVDAALEFAAPGRVQVLKIISDNRSHPASEINGKMVKQLIQGQSALIREMIRLLTDPDV